MTSDAFAREWVQAWNRRDLESLLACYADDVEFLSPLAAKLLGVFQGMDSIVVHFQVRGRNGAEVMEMNREGVVRRALAHSQAT